MTKKITDKPKSITTVECIKYVSDWYQNVTIEIDLNEWTYFTVDFRGESDWYLIGHKCENDKWIQKEFGEHGIWRNRLVDFIVEANSHSQYQKCKVSCFNNMHYYSNFYEELSKLFRDVAIKAERKAKAEVSK